ncbi:hypothetical protein PMAYCL1PPCAC_15811, partial [Pristionchus mayeri]
QTCRANLQRGGTEETDVVALSEEERAEIRAEAVAAAEMGPFRWPRRRREFERRAPKMTAALKKKLDIVEKLLTKVDEDAQKFVRKAGDIVMDGLLAIVKTIEGKDIDLSQYVGEMGKTAKK